MRLPEAKPLGMTLGMVYLALGVFELSTHRNDSDLALLFWGGSLVGGGALVLGGTFLSGSHRAGGLTMLTLGVVLGMNATLWSLVLPVFAVIVLVRFYRVEDAGLMVFEAPRAPEVRD
jgi:hypothetical protein